MHDGFRHRFFELARFGINGLVATGVHFGVLTFNLKILQIPSAGIANFIAALFGITVSFLGNRFFVFPGKTTPLLRQLAAFIVLYALLAVFQGFFLFMWTDIFKIDYRAGFVIATGIQMLLSYLGNKKVVFINESP